jgi:hypothetical protein
VLSLRVRPPALPPSAPIQFLNISIHFPNKGCLSETGSFSLVGMATMQGPTQPALAVTVAPEVAARVVHRRGAGRSVPRIGGTLHLTLGELSSVLRAAGLTGMPGSEVVPGGR